MRKKRQAYTLLEVVLVCALLAIIAAIALPTVLSSYDYSKLYSASDMIRGSWAGARSHSIEEARRYRFSVVVGKGNYRIAPDDASYWSGDPPPTDDQHPALIVEDALPKGIVFTIDNPNADVGGDTALAVGSVSPGQWNTIAYFESDGSATKPGDGATVDITLSMKGQQPLLVTLRCVTGTSKVVKVGRGGS